MADSRQYSLLITTDPARDGLPDPVALDGWTIVRCDPGEVVHRAKHSEVPDACLFDLEDESLPEVLDGLRRTCGLRGPALLGLLSPTAPEPLLQRALDEEFVELVVPGAQRDEFRMRLDSGLRRARRRSRLNELYRQMTAAQQLARCGSWHLDPGSDEILLSDEASHVLGSGTLGGTVGLEVFLSQVPPSDHEQIQNWMAELLAGAPPSPLRHTLIHPADGERIVLHRAQPVLDEQGQVLSLTGVVLDVTDEQRLLQRLEYETHHDQLTGLANRRELEERLEAAIALAHTDHRRVGVLVLDLDEFKKINDSLGHRAGDRLLMMLAERLHEAIDPTAEADSMQACLARIGGNEFAVLLPDLDDGEEALQTAQRALEMMERPFDVYGQEAFIGASIGVSLYPVDHLEPQALIKSAETAMYHAKEAGTGLQQYSSSMNSLARERLSLETSLRRALDRNELEVYYQPKNDVITRRIVGFEALVRWRHPEIGLVSPVRFIPIAEETGLIVPVGEWVLETACRQALRWNEEGHSDLHVSVNLSGRQFAEPHVARTLANIVHSTGLPPQQLELELTESTLMDSTESAIRIMQELKDQGIGLSIDDFGTGYSSLSYLKDFPIDVLKIDRAFVSQMLTDPGSKALTEAIVGIAHSLSLRVVAEGVETEEQLQALRALGCDLVQGYLFSAPVPTDQATALLEQQRPVAPSVR